MKRLFSIIAMVMGLTFAHAQSEILNYGMYMGPLKAGNAKLITTNTTYNGVKAVRMDLIACTTSAAEKIFSLNDTLTTIVNAGSSNPLHFQKHCYEGDDIVHERVDYTVSGGTYTARMRKDYKDGRVKEKTATASTPIYDMVSVVALARNINSTSLKQGQRMKFMLSDAAELHNEVLIYQGRESVKVSGHKFNCMVFKLVEPYMEKGKTKEREILNIYVADDDNRTIVQMDIKFKVGTAKVKLLP